MIGALWTGISGLSGQQTALDNESHNIANVNTIGYKASRISFADQLYQDKIGKGTKVLDAEKLFTQGNLKLTGVAYDLAISGNGFFSVKNERASGSAETFFTRAGNFRMGDNGTLQDSAGNEVQGWGMTALDPDADVTSTNPNVTVFTTDYSKLVNSKVISHSTYVETITAKTTDYSTTAEGDSTLIYDGAGVKTKSSKIQDIEELVSDYTSWLQKYQDDPEGTSAASTAQYSQIKFEGTDIKKEGDQIYVYINGEKITQSYVSVVATTDADGDGIGPGTSTAEQAQDNIAASKIATYKALANQISEIPGLVAYTVKDSTTIGTQGTFEANDVFTKTTFDPSAGGDMEALLGMIEIKSLIPGETFTVSEVAEVSGSVTTQGTVNTTTSATTAVIGSGLGGLQSAREALSRAVSGNQRDVFTPADLDLGNASAGEEYTMEFVVYDKDTKQNVTVGPITLNGVTSINDIVAALPQGGTTATPAAATLFNNYFTAENINGNLIISTNDANYDVEYSTTLTAVNKGFSSTSSLNGSNQEVATFDKTFKPSPDGTKSYTIDVGYENNLPETMTTVSQATIATTGVTDFSTDFSVSLTFDDANNSIGRGGSNQTLEFTISDATNTTGSDLITDIQTQLNSISSGEFTVTSGATTGTMTITNADGETVSSLTVNQVITLPTLVVTGATDVATIASGMNTTAGISGAVTATVDTDGQLVVTLSGGDSGLTVSLKEGNTNDIIEKNADYSGRKGAGAEFIEIVNKIDQVASQGGLQLRLDTLGISDSAFGEFKVSNTGLITMKQDGAEFAIGQVSIALFNNTRGLEPYGDNLMAKTTNSGEPIYNVNNERTANVAGGTLELSTADLSESLVNLMVFQRAFEANAKTITTSDALLNTLINLKR